MVRRALSSLILAASLLLASATWGAFVLSRTVLNPDQSEKLAEDLLQQPAVRQQVAGLLVGAIKSQIPPGIVVPEETLTAVANAAVNDPRVTDVLSDGIVKVHQSGLAGVNQSVPLEAGVLGIAARDAAVALNPDFNNFLPQAPSLTISLPTGAFTWMAAVKQRVDAFIRFGGLLSAAGIITAFAISKRRPKVLRKLAYWSFFNAGFWLLAGFGLPWLAGIVLPSNQALIGGIIDFFFGAMVRPALILAFVGAGLFIGAFMWSTMAVREPAARLGRSSAQPGFNPAGAPPPDAIPIGRNRGYSNGATYDIDYGQPQPMSQTPMQQPVTYSPAPAGATQVYPTVSSGHNSPSNGADYTPYPSIQSATSPDDGLYGNRATDYGSGYGYDYGQAGAGSSGFEDDPYRATNDYHSDGYGSQNDTEWSPVSSVGGNDTHQAQDSAPKWVPGVGYSDRSDTEGSESSNGYRSTDW